VFKAVWRVDDEFKIVGCSVRCFVERNKDTKTSNSLWRV
jgi:hypothetical protein